MSTSAGKSIVDLTKVALLTGPNCRKWSVKLTMHFEAFQLGYVLFEDPSEYHVSSEAQSQPPTNTQVAIIDATPNPKSHAHKILAQSQEACTKY